MLPSDLLARLLGTHLSPTDLVLTPDRVTVTLTPTAADAPCPGCGQSSGRVHGHYRRTLADLPVCGRSLCLVLRLRKFRCPNTACPRHVFCERLPDLASPHARSTTRMVLFQRRIGLALGGEPGSRLAAGLGVQVSGDTVLRRVKAAPAEPETRYRSVGIDDFALRKGHTYGTILIDHERRRVIDLFDGRDGAPVQAWLESHPGVEVLTRDRWAAYANAGSAGAPHALQVADRFHLVGNIRELVERLFAQHASALDAALEPPPPVATEPVATPASLPPPASEPIPPGPPPAVESPDANAGPAPVGPSPPPALSHRQQRRQDRFDEVRRLRRAGRGVRQIARELRISPKTVIDYQRRERCPDWNPGVPRATRLGGFQSAVDAFVREGGRTAAVLHRRLKDQGCRSSYDAVRRFLGRRLQAAGIARVGSSRGPPRPQRPPARALSFEYVRRAAERSDEAAQRMAAVDGVEALRGPLGLAGELLGMARGQSQTPLADWLARADVSPSPSVQSFAESLRTDAAAVQAAFSTAWSNGRTEGHVNRLKAIKRSMYGRASLPLLRARVCANS